MEEKYHQETLVYSNQTKRRQVIWELLSYSHMIYDRVYVFKHFEAFSKSFRDNPPEEYWNGLHYENLIDSIKICIAFENYNKAILLKNGFMVHQIKASKQNKTLAEKQLNEPILIEEFMVNNSFIKDEKSGRWYLDGLANFITISLKKTLEESYQEIIKLDDAFVHFLKGMNQRRNRLHFYKNAYGAFNVNVLLNRLSFAKEYGTSLIEKELKLLKGQDIY